MCDTFSHPSSSPTHSPPPWKSLPHVHRPSSEDSLLRFTGVPSSPSFQNSCNSQEFSITGVMEHNVNPNIYFFFLIVKCFLGRWDPHYLPGVYHAVFCLTCYHLVPPLGFTGCWVGGLFGASVIPVPPVLLGRSSEDEGRHTSVLTQEDPQQAAQSEHRPAGESQTENAVLLWHRGYANRCTRAIIIAPLLVIIIIINDNT